jgi:hypothetical protein
VRPVFLREDVAKEGGAKDIEIRQELLGFVSTVHLLRWIPRRSIKTARKVFCGSGDIFAVSFPNIANKNNPIPAVFVVVGIAW